MMFLKMVQLCVATVLGAVLWLFASVAVHEFGHAFAAKTMTKDEYQVEKIQIWPSLQVYPSVEYTPTASIALGDTHVQMVGKAEPMSQMNTFKPQLELPLEIDPRHGSRSHVGYPDATGQLAPLDPVKLDETRAEADYNVIRLMGAVMTGFISIAAVVCIICFDLSGFKLFLASVLGLLHLDALLYALLPMAFGLPHLGFVGGTQPEPIAALAFFGISPMWSASVIALLSFLQLGLLVQHWQKQGEN